MRFAVALILSAVAFLGIAVAASNSNANHVIAAFPDGFQFGLATAPAHVEDSLDDSWLEWGQSGKIPWFQDAGHPERRLDFWSHPETEIDLAASTGVSVLRLGLDWGRLVPHRYVHRHLRIYFRPGTRACNPMGTLSRDRTSAMTSPCRDGIQDGVAMDRYVRMLEYARSKNLRIMLTLFHHSLPKWANDKAYRGWTNPDLVPLFVAFCRDVAARVAPLVDMYITFNEPTVFANLVYGVGMWPGRTTRIPNPLAYFDLKLKTGDVVKSYQHMVEAHKQVYDLIHYMDDVAADGTMPARVSIAHNIAFFLAYTPKFITKPMAKWTQSVMNFRFMDLLVDYLDFYGINYYGTSASSVLFFLFVFYLVCLYVCR
jgi:beta-glucosidase/6-phospho-beta-glucosidase/beta-galactosidase